VAVTAPNLGAPLQFPGFLTKWLQDHGDYEETWEKKTSPLECLQMPLGPICNPELPDEKISLPPWVDFLQGLNYW